ncbi:hypothetical protein [Tabrizicola sp.]|uniref:hypothetical protein n=1 Tax=Tabrizicola sp. TaxID=2005166 RepID=UPI0027353135|nr:hypothetical protein [Tabrizicola sp.]MDP3197907.1 hypothetical protein [Tabrizicola sp.]
MHAAAPLLVVTALAVPAWARTPDLPGLPVCQDDQGRVVEMQDQGVRGDVVLFWTASDREPTGEMVLADCGSGRALRVSQGKAEDSLDSAAGILRDAIWDEVPHTLGKIQASLRAKGYRASRGSIARGHCACGLARQD